MTLAGRPALSDAQKKAQGTERAGRIQPGGGVVAEPLDRLPPAPKRFRATPQMTHVVVRTSEQKPWMDFQQQERLKASAREAWRRFGAEAVTLKILARGDLAALEQLCWWWGWMLELQERVQLEGPTVVAYSAKGAVVAHTPSPLVGVLQAAEGNVARWLSHFGLTPLSRARVRTAGGGKAEENPFAALQARMRLVRGRPTTGHAAEG